MIEMVMFLAAFDAVWAPCLENPTFFEDGMSKTATLAEDFRPPTNYIAVVRYVNSEERTVNPRTEGVNMKMKAVECWIHWILDSTSLSSKTFTYGVTFTSVLTSVRSYIYRLFQKKPKKAEFNKLYM